MRGERGEGRLGVFVWLAIFGAAIFFAVKAVPAKIAVYEFNDFCEQEIRMTATRGSNRISAEEIRKKILDKAAELEIPIDKKQVKIQKQRNKITAQVEYQMTVDLAVYQWVWDYNEKYESMRM